MFVSLRKLRPLTASLVAAAIITTALSGCTAAQQNVEQSAAPTASREAYFGTRNVRICVSGTPGTQDFIDLVPMQGSAGEPKTIDATHSGPFCYVSNNSSFAGTAGVNVLFEKQTVVVFGQNLALQRPDLLLCTRVSDWLINATQCENTSIQAKETFSENSDPILMKSSGHTFRAVRKADTSDYIEFAVTIVK